MKTTFAIGCLVQWYEVEIVEEYLDTLKTSIEYYDNNAVKVDILVVTNQELEKAESTKKLNYCIAKLKNLFSKYTFCDVTFTDELVTIADYRRIFNSSFCNTVDVLIWGESDMLAPKQMFTTLDLLYQSQKGKVSKFIATFAICKMWDKSWEILEHPNFTDKPFIENDYDNWWSLKYTMSADEMNNFNDNVEDLSIMATTQHKFNGCCLVISSEVIRSGVNIPESVFFVHEDTAFMLMLNKVLTGVPQFIIKNILVVHNRNHPNKRMYIKGESGDTLNKKRRSNEWYSKANKYSEENCYNLFNPGYKSKTWSDVWS